MGGKVFYNMFLNISTNNLYSFPFYCQMCICLARRPLKVGFGVEGFEVRSFVLQLVVETPDGKLVKSRRQAPVLPVDSVIALEDFASLAHTLPLRVYARVDTCVSAAFSGGRMHSIQARWVRPGMPFYGQFTCQRRNTFR